MTVYLSALAGAGQQFFDNSGNSLSGGKLYSYAAGTTAPQTTYTNISGATAHTNPIILDSAGRVATGEIWLTANQTYKFVLKTSVDVTIATWDNIAGLNGTDLTVLAAAEATAIASAAEATAQASLAAGYALNAQTASNSAFVNAAVYASTAAGLAATATGQQFQVVSGNDIIRYRNDAGPVATEIARYPNANSTARLGEGSPSYGNTDGQGDRTASITAFVTESLLAGGTASNLVDGLFANNYTDSIAFNAVAVAGLVISFDFGQTAARVITEATWKQSGAQSHGTWKWQGSNDASTWTDIGSSFTLGGATTQLQTALSVNIFAYRYYRLLGVSGTASAAPYIQEVEFKISKSVVDGYALLTQVQANTIDATA